MPTVAYSTLSTAAISQAFVQTNLAAYAWVFPTNAAQTQLLFPSSNTREVVIINTGGNPLLYGFVVAAQESDLVSSTAVGANEPYAFRNAQYPTAAATGIIPVEGGNCARIPVGGALTISLGTFEQRGSFQPIPGTNNLAPLGYPCSVLFFSSIGGNTTADITYINTFGIF